MQIRNNQSMIKMDLTNILLKTIPSHRKRSITGRRRRTLESGVMSIKIPSHKTDECHSKQSLVGEIKDKESNPDSKNNGRRHINDAYPTATVTTTTIHLEEPIDPEEGECLFYSQISVKGTPLHFIVDSESQNKLISTEVVK
jgi:hypothetical protein